MTAHTHRVEVDGDECVDCHQIICPDTGAEVAYDPDGDVSYWHVDGSTCFLHQHSLSDR